MPETSRLGKDRPFPGLSPFEVSESAWFFGRNPETSDILNRLREMHFIAVVGPSGCGKSSLVKAGVLAALGKGYLGADWRIVSTRPGDAPMSNLIRDLQAVMPSEDLENNLRTGPLGLVGVVRTAQLPPTSRLLIMVDQFEELFQFVRRAEDRAELARRRGNAQPAALAEGTRAREEAKAFLKLLLTAAFSDEFPIYVVITMRSEWLGQCAAYSRLAEAINESLYLVPEMRRTALRKAIVEPILQAEGTIVSPLVDRMLNDLDGRTDQLPVLQHALMLMWRGRRPDQPLTADDYNTVGGFSECLSGHARKVFEGLPSDQRKVAELLFKAITEITPDNRKVRRPAAVTSICENTALTLSQMRPVVTAFSSEDTGFLVVSPQPFADASIIDISHEALIRQWDTLARWVEEECASRRAFDVVERNAESWKKLEDQAADHRTDFLYRGTQLQQASVLLKRPGFVPSPDTLKFLEASRSSEKRRNLIGQIGLAVFILTAAIVAVWVTVHYANKKAKAAMVAAEQERKQAEKDNQEAIWAARLKGQAAVEAERNRLAAIVDQVCQGTAARPGSNVCGELRKEAVKPAPQSVKRLYMQIGNEIQREQARACGAILGAQGFAVQGIEKVAHVPEVTSVRYFHSDDRSTAVEIASAVTRCKVAGATTTLIKGFENVPPRQFELWFGRVLSPPQAAQ